MRKNQKGFTLVELLVVIAILAILATVAVVGYSSFIESANKSVDQQVVAQMNTALQAASVEGRPDNRTALLKLFNEHDIDINKLAPVTEGYAFYWNQDENEIVIVKNGDEVGTNWYLLSSNGFGEKIEIDEDTVWSDIQDKIAASTEQNPLLLVLKKDVELTALTNSDSNKTPRVCIEKGDCVIIDLNSHTLTSSGDGTTMAFGTYSGTLMIKNGNIIGAVSNENGYLTLDQVNITRDGNGGPALYLHGDADTYISKCKITRNGETGGNAIATNSDEDEYDGARIYITDSEITRGGTADAAAINITIDCDITIVNCTVIGTTHGAYFRGCNATIIDSTFVHTRTEGKTWGSGNNGPAADIVFACGGDKWSGYAKTANYVCEGVTVGTAETTGTVIVHEPEGGKVTISGIEVTHKCSGESGYMCTGDDSCQNNKN